MAEETVATVKEKPWYQSKKLAAATLAYVFVILTETLGVKIGDQAWQLVEHVTMTLIGGQSLVDVAGPIVRYALTGKAPEKKPE